ncbi:MAG: hypothetical protein KDB13_17380, partial [Microthrixaceae bacterium]|nr:hypothetical protein [Microthrixaceae bacterium]
TPAQRSKGQLGPAPPGGRPEVHSAVLGDQAVVVKSASDSGRAALRREAEVLARLRQQGVVRVADLGEGADHTELTTVRHGTLTLAEAGLLEGHRRGRALLSLCSAVDGIHLAGWSHGALEPAHVLVDDEGSVRLCSFGEAVELLVEGDADAVADDREALSAIVRSTLETPGAFGSRSERRNWDRSARRALSSMSAKRGLLDGAATAELLRDARVPGTVPANPRRDRTRTRRSLFVAALLALVLGAVLAQLLIALTRPTPPSCSVAPLGRAVSCDEIVVSDNLVAVGGARFEVGDHGDHVAVGDWNCDGTASVLLLEVDTGDLYEFTDWPTETTEVAPELVGSFEGAAGLAEAAPGGCVYPEVVLEQDR